VVSVSAAAAASAPPASCGGVGFQVQCIGRFAGVTAHNPCDVPVFVNGLLVAPGGDVGFPLLIESGGFSVVEVVAANAQGQPEGPPIQTFVVQSCL
jgi:hypothetical protein